RLAMTNSDAALSGSGLWKQGEGSRTTLAFKLDVSDVGKFLDRFGYPEHLKGGLGKLVALMSLQMLPRRAAGDFRDVFAKGFQFDRITSSMAIERGVMGVKDF